MNRFSLVAGCAALGIAAMVIISKRAESGAADAIVRLQQSTPGVQQVGHANLSGTMKAGQVQGDGAGLTSVNADLLDGLNSTAFLQSVPTPLFLSGNVAANAVVQASNSATNGIGVSGLASSGTGTTYGGLFQSNSVDGRGIFGFVSAASGVNYGVIGQSNSTVGRGVFGWASATSGFTYGVQGQSNSTSGRAVLGLATATSGLTYGGRFESASTSGVGVIGVATPSSGTTYGVIGDSNSDVGYGVWATSGFNGWAIYASGHLGASGTKAFRIDHPFDPENRYLLHYSTESPFPQNFYNGNVVTDAQGYAWVDLPDYFSEVNKNFKYQLTVVGRSFAQAIVWEKIKDNRFQIRTNEAGVEVSWLVDADRNDRYVRQSHPKDVVEKQGSERGTYQQPELYGKPPSMGMNYDLKQPTGGETKVERP